jgi:hypothetical protein
MPDTDTPDAVAAPAAAPAPAVSPPANAAAPAVSPKADAADTTPAPDAPGYWAEDWRQRLAGGDEKQAKQLARYGSPEGVWKKALELQTKLSSGAYRPVLGEGATEAEIKEYRTALGIPEAPDKYDLKDVKLDDGDKPFAAEIMKAAHATNQTPDQVAATLKTWTVIKAQALENQATQDQEARTKAEDTLRAEWGTEYRKNVNLVHGLLDGSGDPKLKDAVLGGRLADGTPIGSSPEALKMLLGIALRDNPAGAVVPAGHADAGKTIDTEIARIEGLMRTDRKAYNKEEGRYRELLEVREKMQARAR